MNREQRTIGASLIVGFLFSFGLVWSGMTDPSKVIGFLDVFGDWDPSLLFVMGGAVGVHFVTYRLIRRRPSPLLVSEWQVPTKRDLTPALVFGSALFGFGWGMAGYCPGPAISSLASGRTNVMVFVVFMVIGMKLFQIIDQKHPIVR